jgi:hypothetical protein
MTKKDVVQLDGVGVKLASHDRKASADVGYQVWNPFEAELRIDARGWHDEAGKGLDLVLGAFER